MGLAAEVEVAVKGRPFQTEKAVLSKAQKYKSGKFWHCIKKRGLCAC